MVTAQFKFPQSPKTLIFGKCDTLIGFKPTVYHFQVYDRVSDYLKEKVGGQADIGETNFQNVLFALTS